MIYVCYSKWRCYNWLTVLVRLKFVQYVNGETNSVSEYIACRSRGTDGSVLHGTHHVSNNVSWLIQRPSLVNFCRLSSMQSHCSATNPSSLRCCRTANVVVRSFITAPTSCTNETYNYISPALWCRHSSQFPTRDSWTSFAPTSDNMLIWPTAADDQQ